VTVESFIDFHLFSFLAVLVAGGTIWYERSRRKSDARRSKYLLFALAAMALVCALQFAVWMLDVPAWSQVFVLSGLLYFLALFFLEYAIHVKRIEESFLMDDFRKNVRGLIPWFGAMAALAVLVLIVAPILQWLGFPHPIWGLVALYEVALFVAAWLAGRRVFNLQAGVIRRQGYPFYVQMVVTFGLTVHLVLRQGAGVDTTSFPLYWFTLLNLVFGARMIEELYFWTAQNLRRHKDKLEERQRAQNLLIRRVIGADAEADAVIVRELAEAALDKAHGWLLVQEYRMTGLLVYRVIGGALRVEQSAHILGYCTPLSDNKTIKSLNSTKLADLLTRTAYDVAELLSPRADTLKDFGKRLLHQALTTGEPVLTTELPESLKGLHRLVVVVPVLDGNSAVGVLVAFKDSFDQLLLAEREVLSELADSLSTVYALMRGKDAQRERNRLQGEMSVARELQTSILPRRVELPGFQVATFMETATEVGGDAFDFVNTPFGTVFGIGDVTGHGLPAGMMAVISVAALHGALEASRALNQPLALDQVYDAVNRVLVALNRDRLGSDKFMTQNYFLSDGTTIAHVGTHLVGLVWRSARGEVEELTGLVDQTGFLGLSEYVVSHQSLGSFTMRENDVLVLYSDGVIEAKNGRGDEFGLDGLKAALAEHAESSPQEIIEGVIEDVRRYAAGGDLKKHGRFADDVSLVVLKKE